MVFFKLILYWITLPLKLVAMPCFQLVGLLSNPQRYTPSKIDMHLKLEAPDAPNMATVNGVNFPQAGYPDHSASRTGEAVDINYYEKSALEHFIHAEGNISRAPFNPAHGPPISGDMIAGWLLGFTSPWNESIRSNNDVEKLADWLLRLKDGAGPRLDCGYRYNPMLVGAQAIVPLSLYWTAYKSTGHRKYFWHYVRLILMGYGLLCIFPTAYLHKYPRFLVYISNKIGISLPHNARSFYNDANVMRGFAVMIRQTSGVQRAFFRSCAFGLWVHSRHWHIPFFDFYGLGFIRTNTRQYVATYLKNIRDFADLSAARPDTTAPVLRPKFGESYDDERYTSGESNPDSIGPAYDFFYAGLTGTQCGVA